MSFLTSKKKHDEFLEFARAQFNLSNHLDY